jgi:AGZA family xanthine/uracil permease-like MFS transporter
MNSIGKFFHLNENHTSFKTEFLAGLTTFVSMSYILFVNPAVLGASGMNKGALFTATALSAAFTCIVMGLVANYPIASAPTLGLNAFFTYTVCLGMHVKWQTALAAVFVASILFILLTVFKVREMIIDAIPSDIKYAISAGIGLFIAFIGLQGGKLISKSDSTLVTVGALNNPLVWITIFGLVVTIFLMIARVPGAYLYRNDRGCCLSASPSVKFQCLRPLFQEFQVFHQFLVKLFSILVILILSKCGSLSSLSYWLLSLILLVL